MQTIYLGNCHCGRFRFEISAEDGIINDAIVCDCTLCAKKGYFWLRPPPEAFEVTRDEGAITEYTSKALEDKFCNTCGTSVTGKHLVGPLQGQLLVNVRAIQGINPFKLKLTPAKTSANEGERTIGAVPTLAPGSESTAAHIGSCHCGRVQVELLIPLTELQVKEDNCSTCVRNAYIGAYPNKDQVRVHGRENTFEYRREGGFSGIAHCKACGVTVFSNVHGPPLSAFDRLPPERKERALEVYHKKMALQPLNVRALDGVDLATLQIERSDEGTEGYVLPP
ncbi:Glutathione-dependent formaldehyde-activating enzyme [Coniochaeta hoffmannii]|uniref:Glutathione-dependent formaldehyde-activating enzyme n=1 Tax=Coniochaeta hoffmannii TaxID=91930 RepID=A0AA38VCB9_9PEZI|nr:Glutathione-dependent formaldehyde-activating enzyme [Coniochaeta hoffmannii]